MYRLAWALGKTAAELLATLGPDELAEWLAFERLTGPLGPERGDLQAALAPATVLGMFRGKGEKPVNPADLVPRWGRREAPDGEGKRAWGRLFRKRLAERRGDG